MLMLGKSEKESSRYITEVSERNAERLKTYIPTPTPLFEAFYYMGFHGYIWDVMGVFFRKPSKIDIPYMILHDGIYESYEKYPHTNFM